jgi:hypothetical protein
MPICEGCGGNYDDAFKFCPNCGRPAPAPKAVNQPSGLECPKCHRDDNVAKVSAILQRDIRQTRGQVPVTTVYTDSYGNTNSDTFWHNVSATQMSNLSQTLLPPPPPPKNGCGIYMSVIGAIIVACISLNILLIPIATVYALIFQPKGPMPSDQLVAMVAGSLVSLAVVAILIIITYNYLKKDMQYKRKYPVLQKAWEESMHRYNLVYYCFRDESIFIPGESKYTTPNHLMELIDWHPYATRPPKRVFPFNT